MYKYILGAIVVVVIAAIVFFVIANKKTEVPENTTAQNTVTEGSFAPENTMQGLGTFRSVLAMGKSVSCDVSYKNASTSSTVKGTVYVSDKKFRGDMTTSMSQGTTTMHIISDGVHGYTWANTPQGHFAVMFNMQEQASSTAGAKEQFSLDQPVQYSCKPWVAEESQFVPPTTEKFIDLQAQTSAKGAVDSKSIQCSTCSQITDPGPKAQCLQAFSCK